jgi:hypothetical protein
VQQLCADVGPAVHQEPLAGAFKQQGTSGAAVFRLIRVAVAPVRSDPGNAGRRPAAADCELQLGLALLNNR